VTRFVGHAAVFDVRTAIGNPLRWGFYEEIAPGAFTKTLSKGDFHAHEAVGARQRSVSDEPVPAEVVEGGDYAEERRYAG
jgi:hypothetical protein